MGLRLPLHKCYLEGMITIMWTTLIRPTLVVLSAALILMATLYPYQFTRPVDGSLAARLLLDAGIETPWQIVENILLFAAFGLALSVWLTSRRWSHRAILLSALGLSLGLSYSVELTQYYIPSRFPSRLDLWANTLGGFLAAVLHQVWLRSRIAILFGYATAVVAGCMVLQSSATLRTWNEGFPLVLANEATGDRPWRGEIQRLEFFDTTLSPSQLNKLSTNSSLGGYTFDGALPDPFGSAPPLLTPDPISDPTDTPWFRSATPPTELIRRIKRSNRFTVAVTVTPADLDQSGPARLVTLSADTAHRNLTLGQDGADLIVRLRTSLTGPNGTLPELRVRDVFRAATSRDLVVTYDGSRLRVYCEGTPCRPSLDLHPAWYLRPSWIEPAAIRMPAYQLLYHALLFVPLGILLRLALPIAGRPGPSKRHWPVAIGIIMGSVALEALLANVGTRTFRLDNLLQVLIATLVGFALANGPVRSRNSFNRPD